MTTRPGRLIIVTGLLPLEFEQHNERMTVKPTTGDIESAISAFLRQRDPDDRPVFSDIGWAGAALCKPEDWASQSEPLTGNNCACYPIFLPAKYQQILLKGFANSVLWPLFHYFPSLVEFSSAAYEDYFHMNRLFAERLQKYLRPGDTVWIQDHQLLLLAALLRQGLTELRIGLFLHISYPSFEIFRHLPGDWQEHILHGMLGADLIGFQSNEYAALFRKCVRHTFNSAGDGETLEYNNRLVRTGSFPVGIEHGRFDNIDLSQPDRQITSGFAQNFKGKKVIFSIDALDYTKGILHRIRACEYFIQQYPEYLGKVVFVLVVTPSREYLSRYAEHKKLIDQTVSHVNGKFGSLDWQPLFYMYKSLDFEELLSLYRLSDVALLTPLRDAMNLYAKEFVASRKDEKGVLILSELDGAADQLTGALLVNPNDIPSVANTIRSGLEMPEEEQRRHMQVMRKSVSRHDISRWGKDFLLALEDACARQEQFQVRQFDTYSQRSLLESYHSAHNRQLLLDYDGTLMPFFTQPADAKPGELVIETLARLAEDSRNSVCIISGRDAAILEDWLGHLPIHIVAEHGAQIRYRGGAWRRIALPAEEWKDKVISVMDHYTEKCPGAFVEKKNFSMVWHYRNADPQMAEKVKMNLHTALSEITAGLPLQVTLGKKIVEVRNRNIDKGSAVRNLLDREISDFILAIGDDRTDEDMFRALANKKHAFTIKVGAEASHALFNLPTPQSVISLLGALGHY